jgi:hypothetical protein
VVFGSLPPFPAHFLYSYTIIGLRGGGEEGEGVVQEINVDKFSQRLKQINYCDYCDYCEKWK